MNLKKILLVIGFILATIGIGLGMYYLFFRAPVEELPPEEVPVNAPVTGLPEAEEGPPVTELPPEEVGLPPGVSPFADGGVTAVTPLATVPTFGASLSSSGDLNYYNRLDGKFYRINEDGTTNSLSNKAFFNVVESTFDPAGDKAILEYPDGSNIMFDFATGKQVTLPKHWESFDFDENGTKIAAKSVGSDPDNRWLIVSNPDGSGAAPIQELGRNADKVDVAWSPNNQMVAIAQTGEKLDAERHEIFFVGQHHENFRSMVVEGLNFQSSWSPDGEQLLYSTAASRNDYKPGLWVVDASGDDIGLNRRYLNVDTWAEKCTYSDTSTLYCAVPQELPKGAGLQPKIAANVPDELYRIDLDTGLQTRIAIPEGSHTINSIMIPEDEEDLYFTNTFGTLNKIKLSE